MVSDSLEPKTIATTHRHWKHWKSTDIQHLHDL